MIIDNLLVLSDAQAITAAAASTNVVDQLAAGQALPQGIVPFVEFLVDTTALAAGGASNVTFALQDSADNVTFATIVATPAIAKATLVAGYVAGRLAIPPGARRYLRAYYTPDTNDLTAGKFDARIVLDADRTLDRSL